MIRHIVMWTLHTPADAAYFKAQLDSCAHLVPGMLSLEVGVASPDLDCNCHVVLNSAFTDKAALDAYQTHPHHLAVSANVGKLRLTRHVLDYAV
jgi:quinol monooxygenase YgiN